MSNTVNTIGHEMYDEAGERAGAMELWKPVLSSVKRGPNPLISAFRDDFYITYRHLWWKPRNSLPMAEQLYLKMRNQNSPDTLETFGQSLSTHVTSLCETTV